MEIKIKYHTDTPELEKVDRGDWIDLYSAEDVVLDQFQYAKINLGISMILPEGKEAHVVNRSSTFKSWGIIHANSMSIIDNSYSGTNDIWFYPVIAMRKTVINKGDKICQMRVMDKQEDLTFKKSEVLNGVHRGGYGSSGRR